MTLTQERRERLNELAKDFNNRETRVLLMKEFGDSKQVFSGINEDEKAILISIAKDNIIVKTNQSNGWVRINYYDENGNPEGESFEGRHR